MMHLEWMNSVDANKNDVMDFYFANNWIARLNAIIEIIAPRSYSGAHQSQFDLRMTALRE